MSKRLKLAKFYDPVALVSAIPVTVIVVVGSVLSLRSHSLLRQNRDLVVHTYEVIGLTRNVLLAAEDAETGQRGFLITANSAFLEPYFHALHVTIPAELTNLERMVRDNPRQTRRIVDLRQLIDRKFQELAKTIRTRRVNGFDAARQMVKNQAGKQAMDQIRKTTSDITVTEQSLLFMRTREVGTAEKRIILIAVLTASLSTLMRFAVAFWRQRLLAADRQPDIHTG